ncbi:MAG: TetR/AcrR family transcriptional regulator [Xenococcaceae cyanobacterium MO_188.B32]|nr:TetR/AcrR family transcriptional regulator [Xenococcaceae cyanobacterium MO_188.B32]
MAGVKKFDREFVLDRAMEVFWQQGYEGTSIQDLTKATGLGRGSLYGAFGDKEQLFLTILDRYADKFLVAIADRLNHPDPYQAIEGMFEITIERMSNPKYPRGCLNTNTSVGNSIQSEMIERKIAERLGSLESAIYQVLRKAQAEQKLSPEKDIRAIARFLVGVSQGMAVLNKTFADPSVIQDVAKVALSILEEKDKKM